MLLSGQRPSIPRHEHAHLSSSESLRRLQAIGNPTEMIAAIEMNDLPRFPNLAHGHGCDG